MTDLDHVSKQGHDMIWENIPLMVKVTRAMQHLNQVSMLNYKTVSIYATNVLQDVKNQLYKLERPIQETLCARRDICESCINEKCEIWQKNKSAQNAAVK